ncbi:MAG TPA: hypothetical protein VN653_09955, partial [Anaerolineales bacterium]|nr:hypothetical protein [Anaerolineales bacterium]
KWLILILLIALYPLPAQAQNSVEFQSLNVRLWSEYDQPSMLVIYDFELTPETTLPASVKIRIPKDANITGVAYLEDGELRNAEFSGPAEDGNWQVIKYFIKTRTTYRLEYYQTITRNGNDRSFNYHWTGEYSINNFHIEVQVPSDSTGVKANPMLPFVPSQSFLSGSASVSNLEAGRDYQVNLRYSRLSEEPSAPIASTQVVAAPAVTQKTIGRITLNNLPYILGGVGILLIFLAVFYFWRSNSVDASKSRKRYHIREDNTLIYCQECGTRALTEDRFCRACGSKLRVR